MYTQAVGHGARHETCSICGEKHGQSTLLDDYFNDKLLFMQEVHAFQADCVNELVVPWGLVRTTLVDWPPSQYDYSYADDAGI